MLGLDRLWRVLGSPDLGTVDFERLERRTSPNDALTCPRDLCGTKSDIEPPVFACDASALRAAMASVIASEPRIERVHADDARLVDRYVQSTALMGFPDTIVVRFLERPASRSSIAIYSRSKLGYSDLGANKERIERWLRKLASYAPVAG